MNRIWPAMLQWPAPEDVDDAWRMWVARVAFDAREDAVDIGDEDNDIEAAVGDDDVDDIIEVARDDDGSDGETTLVDDNFCSDDMKDKKVAEDFGLTQSDSLNGKQLSSSKRVPS